MDSLGANDIMCPRNQGYHVSPGAEDIMHLCRANDIMYPQEQIISCISPEPRISCISRDQGYHVCCIPRSQGYHVSLRSQRCHVSPRSKGYHVPGAEDIMYPPESRISCISAEPMISCIPRAKNIMFHREPRISCITQEPRIPCIPPS